MVGKREGKIAGTKRAESRERKIRERETTASIRDI
jgi:hypothetical protein